tara:strand:+ start:279 stop:611 length:333 start_codon:yes stop_codon:yes gene_type:complete
VEVLVVFLLTDEGKKREYSAVIVFPELSGFVIAFVSEETIALDNSLTALLKSLFKSKLKFVELKEMSKLFCLVKFLGPILGVKLLDRSVNAKAPKLNDISKYGVDGIGGV